MTPPRRPFDLAQPFDVHPLGCDCPACADAAEATSLVWSLMMSVVLTSGGIISGFMIGWALEASGALAMIGIG